MENYAKRIGGRLRELRRQAGKTQKSISKLTGLDQSYISRIEQGLAEGTPTQILWIVKAIGATPSDLFSVLDIEPNDDPSPQERKLLMLWRNLSTDEKKMLQAMMLGLTVAREGNDTTVYRADSAEDLFKKLGI